MPSGCFGGADTWLDASSKEFCIEQRGWQCKLAYEGEFDGKYLFWINGTLVTELQKAPLIQKENIPVVCQSENMVLLGDVIKRVTFQLFIEGLLHQFIAEHNARSLCT